ncbi:MAG: hypothetical protein L6R40_004665 [Gallowayella cf. fulva]|nr:MAG: hypothetical protein L6R40_004665 [Xanthomendoza cf. fulva]
MGTEVNAELEHVRSYWLNMKSNSPIYNFLLGDIVIVSATKGQIVAHLKVLPVHFNSKKSLHGVVSACIMDWAGGMAIASEGLDNTGLSTDIHTTFVSTAKEGDMLEIESKASKVGASLAFTTIEIRHAGEGGKVIAHGTHTKYIKK